MYMQSSCVHKRWIKLVYARATYQSHVHLHLILEKLHSTIHTGQPISAHCVKEWAADTNTLSTQAKSLDDVCGAAYSTVHVYLDSILQIGVTQDWHNFRKHLIDAGVSVPSLKHNSC